jgi:Domain of unknown function (DUF4382)
MTDREIVMDMPTDIIKKIITTKRNRSGHKKNNTIMKRTPSVCAAFAVLALLIFSSCSKNQKSSSDTASLQVRLTDGPDANVREVWVDVQQIEIIMSDTSHPIILDGAHPGVYNLLAFSDGKDTLLADATIPAGTISQVRLILGDNNYIITRDGEKIALKTPSGQESGLKVQVHQSVGGGILYRLTLDFDAGRSIIKAGNSGNYLLKPVLRIFSLVPSGGDIQGVVIPDSFRTTIFALQGLDTIASTVTDTTNGRWLFKDLPAGGYSLSFIASDTTYLPASLTASVTLGQITNVDTVKLQH